MSVFIETRKGLSGYWSDIEVAKKVKLSLKTKELVSALKKLASKP